MIYIDGFTPQEWSDRWGVEIISSPCENCKESILLDVPIATSGYRGFEMRSHGCPENFKAATFVPIGDEAEKWKILF